MKSIIYVLCTLHYVWNDIWSLCLHHNFYLSFFLRECEWLRSFAVRIILRLFTTMLPLHKYPSVLCFFLLVYTQYHVQYSTTNKLSFLLLLVFSGLLALAWLESSHQTRDHITEKRAFILLLCKMFNTYLFKHANNISWMSYYLGWSGAVVVFSSVRFIM